MLDKVKPDLVSVCTPNKFHAEQTLAALAVGAHVACEKPMAMNVAEAQAMEDARAKAGTYGLINFSYRNCVSFRFAREMIAQGELGQIQRVNAVYLQSFLGAESSLYSWRNDASLAGFGALGDLGVHMIDSARFITGLSIERVVGVAQTLIPQKKDPAGNLQSVTTDTNSSFLCQFAGGSLGNFETTQIAPGYGNYFRIEISGELGTLAVLSEQDQVIWLHQGKVMSRYGTWARDPLAKINIPTGFAGAQPSGTPACLVDVIRGVSQDYPSFADGLIAQRVVDSIFHSTKTGSWMELKHGIKPGRFLDPQVFVDRRGAELVGRHADGEDAAAAQTAQGALIIIPNFHRGDMLINLEFGGGHLAGDGHDFGVADGDNHGQMARQKRQRGLEQAIGRVGVAQVGEANNQCSPRAVPQHVMKYRRVIRFQAGGLQRGQVSHQVRHLGLAFFRLGEGGHLVVEDGVADEVAFVQGDLREMHGGVNRVIEFSIRTDFRAHQAACVDHDHQPLIPFGFVLAGDELAALGGGFPIDVAEIVVALVLAQRFKFAAFAAQRRFAASRLDRPGQRELQVPRAFARHIRQHLHLLREIDFRLPLDQAQRPGDPVKDRAEGEVAALVTFQAVGLDDLPRGGARRNLFIRGEPVKSTGGESTI